MYPGSNNYDQNYLNQQQKYNAPSQQFSGAPGLPAGGPPIGFNVGMGMNQAPNFTPGYVPPPASYDSYNQYPKNNQLYMPPPQNYPNQYVAPQSQNMPGQHGIQYPQNQYLPANVQSYGDTTQQIHGQQMYSQQTQERQIYGQPIYGQPLGGSQPYGQPMGSQHLGGQQAYSHSIVSHQGGGQASYVPPMCSQQTGSQNQYSQQNQNQPISKLSQSPAINSSDYYRNANQQVQEYNTTYSQNANLHTNIASIGSSGESYKGTMKPCPNFNPEQDCNTLKKAMKGLGTDEKSIIECLGRRNHTQRLEIKKTFKIMFGKDLLDELKSELSGNFSRAVIESLYDSDYYDAYSLYKAMEGAGTREDVLTEILTSRSNQQINNIKDIYKKTYRKDLEKEVISETSGFYKRVLVSCLQANKKELTADEVTRLRQQGPSAIVNINLAKQEAQELYNAGEKKIGTDEACFIRIFATRNKYQLKATFDEYQKISGRDIITSIEREMSGDLSSALKAIAAQAINPALYFATRLYNAMKGLGTNDTALIRIVITRSEIDLENIKIEFQKQFGKTLSNFIREDTSGDYFKYLSRFVDGN